MENEPRREGVPSPHAMPAPARARWRMRGGPRRTWLPGTPRWRSALLGGVIGVAVAVAALVDPGGLFEVAALKALDLHFAARGAETPTAPIVLVTIDEDSFDELDLTWPWPRALHARLIEAISAARPAAIGLDLVFAEPSLHGPADDEALAAAVARARNVVLGAALTKVEGAGFVKRDLNPPVRPVRDGAAAWAVVGFDTDADAFVRRARPAFVFQGRPVPSFTLALSRVATAAGVRSAPLTGSSEMIINFRGGPRTFPSVPYHRVLGGEVPAETFAGKIVLVGATSPVLHDVYATPFARRGTMPGVEIHANALETLWRGIPIQRAPTAVVLGAAIALATGAAWVVAAVRSPMLSAVLAIGGGGAVLVAAHALFVWGRLWAPVVAPLVALVGGYGASTVESVVREQRQRRRLSRYFSPSVVSEIVRGEAEQSLASSRRRVTVLFSDIRGFTAMSESMAPEAVARFLREYLTAMTEVVFRHGGTVDKYVGDAIMALYNVPFEQPDHAARAIRTALDFQSRLAEIAGALDVPAGRDLRCGVGIHTGEAVVGTIGSEQRLEYTAIGDTINLGARLESLTKDHGVSILISEATRDEVGDAFDVRDLGEVPVRGKARPVKLYAVLGVAGATVASPASPPVHADGAGIEAMAGRHA